MAVLPSWGAHIKRVKSSLPETRRSPELPLLPLSAEEVVVGVPHVMAFIPTTARYRFKAVAWSSAGAISAISDMDAVDEDEEVPVPPALEGACMASSYAPVLMT